MLRRAPPARWLQALVRPQGGLNTYWRSAVLLEIA
jgi:hypothetical protein